MPDTFRPDDDKLSKLLKKIDDKLMGWENTKTSKNLTPELIAEGDEILAEEAAKKKDES